MNAEDRRTWAWVLVSCPGSFLAGRGLACTLQSWQWPLWGVIATAVIAVPAWAALMYLLLPKRTRYLTVQWKKAR
jgi:hypothetical protein